MRYAIRNCASEWSYSSGKAYADPFNEVELNVAVTDPEGRERLVPAFWTGGQTWRVRFASPVVGRHRYRTVCSDETNADLHGQEGELEVTEYEGENPLLRHGPLRVHESKRYLEHADGTPFLWLGDTWWMGLTTRITWPEGFQRLVADRVAKGFSLIQIVMGLFPDMPGFDPKGANEAGFPWEPEYARINPSYFDMADLRIAHLVDRGLVPCIVACWGYYLQFAGVEVLKQHWRNLVARYGAYPVVWCLCGEVDMPWYLGERGDEVREKLVTGWSEIAAYLRELDPYGHPITVHPGGGRTGRMQLKEEQLVDIDMLQTGHGMGALSSMVDLIVTANEREPRMPVVNGEPWYEGIMGTCWQDAQRYAYWVNMLSGSCGHTYGANGIWQFATEEEPCYSVTGSWGSGTWEEAAQYPGSGQVGASKRALEQLPWWLLEPHQEWVEPHATREDPALPWCAGIPGALRVIYLPGPGWAARTTRQLKVVSLEAGSKYEARWLNPRTGESRAVEGPAPAAPEWSPPPVTRFAAVPSREDWVLVLEDREKLAQMD